MAKDILEELKKEDIKQATKELSKEAGIKEIYEKIKHGE